MNIEVVFILFWLYSFLGWIMETVFVSIKSKKIINRGFLIGPYCPIYGTGGVLLLALAPYQNDPLIVFLLSIIICSIVEYLTSYVLEQIYKIRWWDYSNRFLNLNGRICFFNSICFGLLGMLVVIFLNPFFLSLIQKLNPFYLNIFIILLFLITITDIIITFSIMFDIRNSIINYKEKTLTNLFKKNQDNTETISKKIRETLKQKTFIHKHLFKSFTTFKVYKNYFNKNYALKKAEQLETSTIISSILSIVIGFLIGKMINKVSLMISISFALNIIILKIVSGGREK